MMDGRRRLSRVPVHRAQRLQVSATITLLRLALLALSLFSTQSAPSERALSDQELAAIVDGLTSEAMDGDPAAVGLSVAVALEDEPRLARGYGLAELEHGVKTTPETLFRIGSITKQFTAAAVCLLAESLEVDVDVDLHDYVPDFPTQGHVVTVRHLLTHTSGIPSYTGLGPSWERTLPLELDHAELLAMVAERPFDFPPGRSYRYNNTGYYLLGVLIENVSGVSYPEFVSRELTTPLGLAHTRYGSNSDVIPDRAQGYRLVEGELKNDELIGMSQPGAAGALLSTASDLVAWDIALRAGRVVRPETYEEMTLPFLLEDARETEYGFGLFLADRDGRPCVSHGGGIKGFNSFLAHYPEHGVTIAVLSNSEGFDSSEVELEIARALCAR